MKRTVLPTLLAAGLFAAACTGSDDASTAEPDDEPAETQGDEPAETPAEEPDDEPGDATGGPVGFAPAALRQFDECDAFLDYVHTEGAERVGAWGFGDNGWFPEPFLVDDVASEEPAEEAADSADASASVPSAGDDAGGRDGSFSTTNVQVEGVDEPDIVKTDGDRILAIAGEQLHLVTVSPDGGDGELRSSVPLSDPASDQWLWNGEILFDGDRAFIIGQSEYWAYLEDDMVISESTTVDAVEPGADPQLDDATETIDPDAAVDAVDESTDAEAGFAPEPLPVEPDAPIGGPLPPVGGYQGPTTIVHEVDLSNPDAISIVNTLEVRGRYVSARQIGSTARIVVTSAPADLGFVYPSDGSDRSIEVATETNQRLVAESDVDHWLPTYTLRTASGSSEGRLVDCANVHAPTEFAGFDMLSVVTFGTDEPLAAPSETVGVMASGDTVYASQDRLYVTTNVWLPPTIDEQQRGEWEEEYETQIHRFSIAGEGPAAYEASGSVDGHLLNQFSMNDRDGIFYVATTEGTPWGAGTDNQIIAMQVEGQSLVEVGRLDDLGLEGERIFSVRYVDDLAYLVTFRQTDPFYVIDLSDPTAMSVLGELKIPGFSSYLHPIGDTLVLGVGQDATEGGRTTGTKVSLFDVSDPANPLEVDVWTLPGGGSDAEFDHRAFLYWPATQTAFLPVTQWNEGSSGAVALRVNEDGIEELGRITQEDPAIEPGQTDCQVFDGQGLTEDDGEFFWIVQEGLILLCDSQDDGGATGYFCDPIPADELRFWTGDGQVPDAFEGVERVEICWPEGIDWQRQIRRLLVIEDSVWSLSNERLQANDLATLATGDIVTLPAS